MLDLALQRALSLIAGEGWGVEGGDPKAPSGGFVALSITFPSLAEVDAAYGAQIREYGVSNPNELVGHWLIVFHEGDARPTFQPVATARDLAQVFRVMEKAYDIWRAVHQ
jgi:hypothetical protein